MGRRTIRKPDVICVEITKEAVMEMKVGVEEDGSMDGRANISFPFSDSSVEASFLFGDILVLDQMLNSSEGKVVNPVATKGLDGRMTLSTHIVKLGMTMYKIQGLKLWRMKLS